MALLGQCLADVGGEVEGAKGADRAVVSRQGLGQCHAVRDGGCRLFRTG